MFKVDFIHGDTVTWHKTEQGVKQVVHPEYSPRFYIEGSKSKLQRSRTWLSSQRHVKATSFEKWKPTLSKKVKYVLRVDVSSEEGLYAAVNKLKKNVGRSTFKYYNVGFSPQFRYCLQNQVCPLPEKKLKQAKLKMDRKSIADKSLSNLRFNGERLGRNPVQSFVEKWRRVDPDLVFVSRGEVLTILQEKLSESFSLGRTDGFEQLAGENIVSSYGKTVYSAPRYNIPGRVLIDESNSFLLGEATIEGMWGLVERSFRPLQELAWGSIGRLLTSIEVKKAYLEENTLTPWKNWRPETPKKAETMHRADRGGFIFNPEPGIHRDVYEADFASLFPNIMVKKNISPETVCCDCCDNGKVPELDYSICENQRGFISQVLKPLVEDRQRMKQEVEQKTGREAEVLQGEIDGIKWLLVSCFGYMGHSHASYGAIECHQAIQAFDRDIMVKTKDIFEENKYNIVHGIIDSIWVQKQEGAKDFEKVCQEITEEIGIKLEPEHNFEWCAFIPRKSSKPDISTLNRYFGKKKDGGFKTAGIEADQRSTSKFVKNTQIEMIKRLDEEMKPQPVIEFLKQKIRQLKKGNVDVEDLLRSRKVSKHLEDYNVENKSVSAMKRARRHGIEIKPGQSVHFVVRNDDAPPINRTRLDFELDQDYDKKFYRDKLIDATISILSPLGLNEEDINRILKGRNAKLSKYSSQT